MVNANGDRFVITGGGAKGAYPLGYATHVSVSSAPGGAISIGTRIHQVLQQGIKWDTGTLPEDAWELPDEPGFNEEEWDGPLYA